MKQAMAASLIAALACFTTVVPAEGAISPQAQIDQIDKAETFTGKVVSARQKGSMAKPYIVVGVAADDGQELFFNLRKNTELTDVNGKTLRALGSVKKERRVEVKYTVKDGQNEAISIHYLD